MKLATVGLALTMIGAVVLSGTAKDKGDDRGKAHEQQAYTIGLFGDMPYNALGRSQFPALLADINASHVAFSVFDGDLKAGGDGPCDDKPVCDGAPQLRHAGTAARLRAW
jgi:hypothetical protein